MFITNDLAEKILINPVIRDGADCLKIVSAYATPTMASWHIKQLEDLPKVKINLIVGMSADDGISLSVHQGFNNLMNSSHTQKSRSDFKCQYIYQGKPVHSILYIWERREEPFLAFTGSANYTQPSFGGYRQELMTECDPADSLSYYNLLDKNSIFCNHAEVEDCVIIRNEHPIFDSEESPAKFLKGKGVSSVTLSLLTRGGDIGFRSGLNWGQRPNREPNQAYIPLPSDVVSTGFFPLNGRHFSVITDDRKQLILRVEQQNNKAITTPLNNSLLGEYFRNRLNLANGASIKKQDLINYGRSDVTFFKLDEEQFFMDFSL